MSRALVEAGDPAQAVWAALSALGHPQGLQSRPAHHQNVPGHQLQVLGALAAERVQGPVLEALGARHGRAGVQPPNRWTDVRTRGQSGSSAGPRPPHQQGQGGLEGLSVHSGCSGWVEPPGRSHLGPPHSWGHRARGAPRCVHGRAGGQLCGSLYLPVWAGPGLKACCGGSPEPKAADSAHCTPGRGRCRRPSACWGRCPPAGGPGGIMVGVPGSVPARACPSVSVPSC